MLAAAGLAACTVGCDRLSKTVAVRELSGVPGRSFLGGVLRLQLVGNRGGFLSLGVAWPDYFRTGLLLGVPSLLLLVLLVLLARGRFGDGWAAIGMTLVWAGGASNMIDRIGRGEVVDFLNLGIGPLRTGVFNVADLAITCGSLLALLGFSRSRRPALRPPSEAR